MMPYESELRQLTPEFIRACLLAVSPTMQPLRPYPDYRQAAVLVPLLRERGDWSLLFIRRTDQVQTHKGQVSFPGGGEEAQDRSPVGTALRETYEEVGISPSDVQILGQMNVFPTISSYLVTPVVAEIAWPVRLTLQPTEVDQVFTIPLGWLCNPEHWQERMYQRAGCETPEPVIFFEKYNGELLWGITARITVDFLNLIGLGSSSSTAI